MILLSSIMNLKTTMNFMFLCLYCLVLINNKSNVAAQDLVSSCSSEHSQWADCVASRPECQFCLLDMPQDCTTYSSIICGLQVCCPPCDDSLLSSFQTCAESSTPSCTTPSCETAEQLPPPTTQEALDISSCANLLDGYTNCVDAYDESLAVEMCTITFNAYENCIENLDLTAPDDSSIGWCTGFHDAWALCVSREGCNDACETKKPDECDDYQDEYCNMISCCPKCEPFVSDSYNTCAEVAGCSSPNCAATTGTSNGVLLQLSSTMLLFALTAAIGFLFI